MGAGGSTKVYGVFKGKPNIIKVRERKGVSTCENNVTKSATLKVKRKEMYLPMIEHNVKPGSQPPNNIGGVLVFTCENRNNLTDPHTNSAEPFASPDDKNCKLDETEYAWFVEDVHEIGSWEMYNSESTARLEEAYLSGQPNCMVVYKGHTATVDFNNMEQLLGSSEVGGLFSFTQPYRQQQQQEQEQYQHNRRAVKRCSVESYVDETTGTVAKRKVERAVNDPFEYEYEEEKEQQQQQVNHHEDIENNINNSNDDNAESANSCNDESTTNKQNENIKVILSSDRKRIEIIDMTPHMDTTSINNVYNVFADTNIEEFAVARNNSPVSSDIALNATEQQTELATNNIVPLTTPAPRVNTGITSARFECDEHKIIEPIYTSTTGDDVMESEEPITRESVPVLHRTIKVLNGSVFTMELSTNIDFVKDSKNRDETLILAAGKSNKLVECDIRNGFVYRRHEYKGANSAASTLNARIAPSTFILAAASDDNRAYIFRRSITTPALTLRGHKHKVYDVHFSHNVERVYTVSMDGTMRSWNLAHYEQYAKMTETKDDENPWTGTMQSESTYELSTTPIFSLALSPTNPNIMLAGGNSTVVTMLDLREANVIVQRFTGHKETVWCCRFSRDSLLESDLSNLRNEKKSSLDTSGIDASNIFASCGLDGTVRLWDVRKAEKVVHEINPHTRHPVHYVEFTYNNKGLLSCARDGTVALTDTLSGKCVWRAKTSNASAFRVHEQLPGNNSFVVCSTDGLLNVWKWKASEFW